MLCLMIIIGLQVAGMLVSCVKWMITCRSYSTTKDDTDVVRAGGNNTDEPVVGEHNDEQVWIIKLC